MEGRIKGSEERKGEEKREGGRKVRDVARNKSKTKTVQEAQTLKTLLTCGSFTASTQIMTNDYSSLFFIYSHLEALCKREQ